MEVVTFATRRDAELALAREIAALIRDRARTGRPAVLGLATGRTPVGVYAELARMHREEGLSFAGVTTFNLDELDGLFPDDPTTFRSFMRARLFDRVDLDPERAHLLPSDAGDAHPAACAAYEAAIAEAGGIDLQVLGVGLNGHVGFNEPGSPPDARTRRVALHPTTRRTYAAAGPDRPAPTHALTMGVATIRAARRLRILALGAAKAEIVAEALRGEPRPAVPVTLLRDHPDARLLLDEAAAAAPTPEETA